MKIQIKEIIGQMTPEVRKKVQEAADKKGMTLEDFGAQQLAAQVSDREVEVNLQDARADGRIDATADPTRGETRVGGSISVHFLQ